MALNPGEKIKSEEEGMNPAQAVDHSKGEILLCTHVQKSHLKGIPRAHFGAEVLKYLFL